MCKSYAFIYLFILRRSQFFFLKRKKKNTNGSIHRSIKIIKKTPQRPFDADFYNHKCGHFFIVISLTEVFFFFFYRPCIFNGCRKSF